MKRALVARTKNKFCGPGVRSVCGRAPVSASRRRRVHAAIARDIYARNPSNDPAGAELQMCGRCARQQTRRAARATVLRRERCSDPSGIARVCAQNIHGECGAETLPARLRIFPWNSCWKAFCGRELCCGYGKIIRAIKKPAQFQRAHRAKTPLLHPQKTKNVKYVKSRQRYVIGMRKFEGANFPDSIRRTLPAQPVEDSREPCDHHANHNPIDSVQMPPRCRSRSRRRLRRF
jgi:hypothetical protein